MHTAVSATAASARVGELGRVDHGAVALPGTVEEVRDPRRAVVLGDERADRLRQLVLLGEVEPVAHVVPDDRRAGVRLELVVRVAPLGLVLHEVLRLLELADVVVVRADAREQPVRPIALQAASARLAIAIVCAYVPGASRLSRCMSGRFRSDHSSSRRYVSIPVNSSAGGSSPMASATETMPLSAPSPALIAIVRASQPSVRPMASAASA
jgi:hypothetical protein